MFNLDDSLSELSALEASMDPRAAALREAIEASPAYQRRLEVLALREDARDRSYAYARGIFQGGGSGQ